MTSNVDKLKELLFDREAATIDELSRRLDAVADADRRSHVGDDRPAAALEAAQRDELARTGERVEQVARITEQDRIDRAEVTSRLTDLYRRAGTPAALQTSVAEVLDQSIVEARATRQDLLSRAMAPLLIKTIQAELKNNQAAMVEALYPITGKLVKAYVASAMKELTNNTNRRLRINPVMLGIRSLASGRPMSDLAIADTQRLEIEELLPHPPRLRRARAALATDRRSVEQRHPHERRDLRHQRVRRDRIQV